MGPCWGMCGCLQMLINTGRLEHLVLITIFAASCAGWAVGPVEITEVIISYVAQKVNMPRA